VFTFHNGNARAAIGDRDRPAGSDADLDFVTGMRVQNSVLDQISECV